VNKHKLSEFPLLRLIIKYMESYYFQYEYLIVGPRSTYCWT